MKPFKPSAIRKKAKPTAALTVTNTKIAFTWDAPDESLLEDRRGTLPQFPQDVFLPGLSDWLSRASRGAGTLIDHIAVPMLGVTSSLIGKARRIQANTSWIEPMTLWACVVGESGNRKTPGLKVIMRALDQIEEENKPLHLSSSIAHVTRVENARAEMKRWRKECAEAVDQNQEPPQMPIEALDPGEFIWPALYVTDSTIARIGKLCMIRPRGMIQIRDELAGLFASAKQLSSTRSFYLQAWDGNKFIVERVDDDRTFTVDNLLIGVIGGFQPDRLARAFEGDQDGMYGRFLYGWPETPDYNPLTDEISETDPVFQNLLTKLIRLPDRNEDDEFAPLTIPLSIEARKEFEKYRIFAHQEGRGIEGREHQWLSKSEAHTLRLAGTLAYLAWADDSDPQNGVESISATLEPSEIDQQSMVNAVRLMREYFWLHARAALRQIGLTKRHSHIRKALRWVRANDRHEVSLKDIRREALGETVDVKETRELFEQLVGAGWMRAAPVVKTGGRPVERWTINPKVFEPFGGYSGFGGSGNHESAPRKITPKKAPQKPQKSPKGNATKRNKKRRRT